MKIRKLTNEEIKGACAFAVVYTISQSEAAFGHWTVIDILMNIWMQTG